MIIVKVEKFGNIEKALKHFKKKFQTTRVVEELRNRKEFTKKSVSKRQEKIKAAYKQTFKNKED
jgi:small subunit ribosomal protein S21